MYINLMLAEQTESANVKEMIVARQDQVCRGSPIAQHLLQPQLSGQCPAGQETISLIVAYRQTYETTKWMAW